MLYWANLNSCRPSCCQAHSHHLTVSPSGYGLSVDQPMTHGKDMVEPHGWSRTRLCFVVTSDCERQWHLVSLFVAGISFSSHIAATCNLCSLDQFQNKKNGVLYTRMYTLFWVLIYTYTGHRIIPGFFYLQEVTHQSEPSRIHQHLSKFDEMTWDL